MAFHHVALATTDLAATHEFYTEAMGFRLIKALAAPTDHPDGWAKHLFYDTGGDGLIAFWELHDPRVPSFDPRISEGLGLPTWVNHLAFAAADLDDLRSKRERWQDQGIDVAEIDHGFCVSIYATDPNGILVEWCTDTAPYTTADQEEAVAILVAEDPALGPAPGALVPSRTQARAGGRRVTTAPPRPPSATGRTRPMIPASSWVGSRSRSSLPTAPSSEGCCGPLRRGRPGALRWPSPTRGPTSASTTPVRCWPRRGTPCSASPPAM